MIGKNGYPARFLRAVDGDTFVFQVARFGSFEIRATVDHYRLANYMAREITDNADPAPAGETRVGGKLARDMADAALRAGPVEVRELGLDKYGRILAEVYVNGSSLGAMLEAEHAVKSGSAKGIAQERDLSGR